MNNTDQINALARELRAMAFELGASHTGVADLRPVHEVWRDAFDKEECGLFPSGISICVPEEDDLLDNLPVTDSEYRTSHYQVKINGALKIGDRLCEVLKEHGFDAYRLSHPPKNGPTGLFKMIGHLAGIGWIGKNRLLITPERGPRIALAAVLTDAPLPPSAEKPMENRCGDCTRCIDACPVRAFKPDAFELDDSLQGFNTGYCALNRGKINPTYWGGCGFCMKECPYGRRKANLLKHAVQASIREEEGR